METAVLYSGGSLGRGVAFGGGLFHYSKLLEGSLRSTPGAIRATDQLPKGRSQEIGKRTLMVGEITGPKRTPTSENRARFYEPSTGKPVAVKK